MRSHFEDPEWRRRLRKLNSTWKVASKRFWLIVLAMIAVISVLAYASVQFTLNIPATVVVVKQSPGLELLAADNTTIVTSIAFGDVAQGETGTWSGYLKNTGNVDLHTFSIASSDIGSVGTVTWNMPTSGDLGVGQTCPVTITLSINQTAELGSHAFTIQITGSPTVSGPSPTKYGTLFIVNGSGTFSSVSATSLTINVSPGQVLSGSVTLDANNSWWKIGDVIPLIGTPSWGNDSTSWWLIDSSLPWGSSIQTANVQLIAPLEPGTYYIIFAFHAEETGDQVASATNWALGYDVWGDGNDIAEFNATQIAQAQQVGGTVDNWLVLGPSGTPTYILAPVPAAAITVVVSGTTTHSGLALKHHSGFASTILAGSGFSDNSRVTITWDGTTITLVPPALCIAVAALLRKKT